MRLQGLHPRRRGARVPHGIAIMKLRFLGSTPGTPAGRSGAGCGGLNRRQRPPKLQCSTPRPLRPETRHEWCVFPLLVLRTRPRTHILHRHPPIRHRCEGSYAYEPPGGPLRAALTPARTAPSARARRSSPRRAKGAAGPPFRMLPSTVFLFTLRPATARTRPLQPKL